VKSIVVDDSVLKIETKILVMRTPGGSMRGTITCLYIDEPKNLMFDTSEANRDLRPVTSERPDVGSKEGSTDGLYCQSEMFWYIVVVIVVAVQCSRTGAGVINL
jgi:hypothetical protein